MVVIICPDYLRQMSLSPDEGGVGGEKKKEREIERERERERENGSVHFKLNQYPW